MKQQIMTRTFFYALSVVTLFITACQKGDNALSTGSNSSDDSNATTSTIAVLATASVATADSVYLMQPCQRGSARDSIGQSDLPIAVTGYLETAYAGSTFDKAFAIKDSNGMVTGYVVVIYYNDKPVGLEFGSTGNFIKVLEQRERGDLRGWGFHDGGRFQHRDGKNRDTVALSSLPTSVLGYFASNYSTDTLLKAYKGIDSSYVVLSKNNGVFATLFDASGSFVKRESLPAPRGGRIQGLEQANLPDAITTYLNTTYPGFAFKKAFALQDGTAVKGYVVFIDANNTKYALEFDASGTFVEAKTVF